jgi:hypothetical protein
MVAAGGAPVNRNRVYRIMKAQGWLLARHTGKSTRTHDGVILTLRSNLRWCSDAFEVRCWNGARVQVAFSDGLEEADDARGEGVVVRIANAADRALDASLGETLGVTDGHLRHAAVAVVHEVAGDRAQVQRLLQRIER